MTLNRPYTAGQFELTIDGPHPITAFVKSVDGGFARAKVVDEKIGPHPVAGQHDGGVEIEPFTFEIGLSGVGDILKWIQNSWLKNEYSRRNGQITHADFDQKTQLTHAFTNALILETAFPALGDTSPAYLTIKIQPESVQIDPVPSSPKSTANKANVGAKQKLWSTKSFRFTIDGLRDMDSTLKLDAFTITQSIKTLYTGEDPFPQIEPTNIKFPNLTGTIPLESATELFKWRDQSLKQAVSKTEKHGSIQFLSPDRSSTVFGIDLYEMGISSIQVLKSVAGSEELKLAKFDLYVGRMELDLRGKGFE